MQNELIIPQTNTVINVTHDTQFILDFKEFDGQQLNVNLIFDKPGVRAELLGLYFLKEGQRLDLITTVTHTAQNTTCFTTIRGVLGTATLSKYTGKIIIKKPAQQTNSFLNHGVLVVGENTQNSSEPILEIEADDVKASHGATTSRINKDQIYYLMSRGLSKQESENLITEGFFEELLGKIADERIREKIRSNLM